MKLKRVIPVLGLTLALTAATACGSKAEDTAVRIYGEIEEVSEEDIIVDNQSDMSSQGEMILTIDPENTVLVDGESGLPLELSDVEKGSFVAYLGPAMTLSLPPQCTPEVVFTNVSEKEAA